MTLSLSDTSLLQQDAFIGGGFIPADGGETYEVRNPATGALIATVSKCDAADCRTAIAAAERAFLSWREVPAKQRSTLMMSWHKEILAAKDDLAHLLCAEQGKPLSEARAEILYGASYIHWFAEEAKRIYGDIIAPPSNDSRLFCFKQPVGVVACITPWNFPNAMLARKIAPAIAAGCTVVCKPANETPLSALALGELARRAGIPDGVINIISGKTAEIGEELTSSPVVRKLTFTGSTAVGKKLAADCAKTMKRTSMELGGNAPFIVFESADIDLAVENFLANKFRNAGQTCVCVNRVLVHASIADAFTEKAFRAISNLRTGDGLDPSTDIGPLISRKAAANIAELLRDAEKHGGVLLRATAQSDNADSFMEPVLIRGATPQMRVFREEIFGPAAPIFEFHTEAEAIDLANATPFGLAAYFYSQDMRQIWRVADRLDAGMIGVNEAVLSNEMIPFGGVKESGHGREGSKYGLDDYLDIKHVKLGGLSR